MLDAMLRAVAPAAIIHFVPKENNQGWATSYSAAGVQSFEPTGDSETLTTKSLVVSWSQRRQQQRSRLALKCAQEQDSVQARRPKVSKATQTLSFSPGSQIQRASQSCQPDEECQTTQNPTASQACEQTGEEGPSLSQDAADFSTAGALKDTVLLLNNTLQTFLEALQSAGPPNQPTANVAQGAADFPADGTLKDTVLLLNYTLQTAVEALMFAGRQWAASSNTTPLQQHQEQQFLFQQQQQHSFQHHQQRFQQEQEQEQQQQLRRQQQLQQQQQFQQQQLWGQQQWGQQRQQACAAARTSTEPHYRSGIQTRGAYPGLQAVTAAQTPQGWNVAAIHGGASSAPAAAGSEAAEAARQNPPALTAERPGLEFSAEFSVENQSDFPTYCPYVATMSPGGASSAPAAAGSEAAEAARECPALTAERPGLEFYSEPPVDFAATNNNNSDNDNDNNSNNNNSGNNNCNNSNSSVEYHSVLLTNCPGVATIPPSGASSASAAAGAEAQEAKEALPDLLSKVGWQLTSYGPDNQASSVSNDVSFEELRWMQRQKPQETWGEAFNGLLSQSKQRFENYLSPASFPGQCQAGGVSSSSAIPSSSPADIAVDGAEGFQLMSAQIGDFADNCQLCLVTIECACDRGIPLCVNCYGRVPLASAHRLGRNSGPNNYINGNNNINNNNNNNNELIQQQQQPQQQPQQQQQQEQQEQEPQLERQQQHDVLTNGLDVATKSPGGTSTLPVAAGSEAAQAASECPALAEERFELYFFAEVSVENQFDLLTNCPHYATTSPGGASSLPSSVPNVAGSEAAEAVSECPAFTAERPGPEFFPEPSGENQVEVLTYGVDVATAPPGGASSAGAAGSGMIETVRDCQAGGASSAVIVPSSGAAASSAIVTASPSPVGVDDNILLATNGDSYNNNNNINFDNNNKNIKKNVVNSHISKKQHKQRLQQRQLQQLHLHEQREQQQQDDLRQQQQLPLHQPYQHERPEQQPGAETPTPDEGTGAPAPAETYTPVDASRLWKRSSTSRRPTPRKENRF
ncbi:unnamed protein product, partial [Polarella glacialis]